MKAIVVDNGTLQWRDAPTAVAGAGEVLIRNHATAINRADLAQRAGAYPPPPGASAILGLECAGEVIAVGDGVTIPNGRRSRLRIVVWRRLCGDR